MEPSILIVGAGPSGLTAAIELARRGFHPRVIDRDEGPTPLSKAVGIAPRSLHLLEPSGVTGELLQRGIRMRAVQVHMDGAVLATIDLGNIPDRYDFLLALPQHETETVMARVLAGFGFAPEWRTELVSMTPVPGGWRAVLRGPEEGGETTFSHVLGADGMHSAVRESAGIAFEGYIHKRQWSIADAVIPDWPYRREAGHAFLARGGDIGFVVPIGEDAYRAVSNTPDALAHVPGIYTIRQILRTDVFDLPIRQAARYHRDGAYLCGDAAHVHSPIGARGMNLGIEDAAAFARRFAEGTLDGYEAERKPVGARWIDFSERLLQAVESDSALFVPVRNLAIRTVGAVPLLQKRMLRRVAGLVE
ncbi:MAG: FAD-dependent oxidoreductase [Flavobacteriaceae bacterium]